MVTHPGEVLRIMLEEGLRLNTSEAARQLGISRQGLHNVLSGRARITPEMALTLGRLVGSARMWMNLQASYDLVKTREKMPPERLEPITAKE